MLSTTPAETQYPDTSHDKAVCNIAHHLPRMAKALPDRAAVIVTDRIDRSGRATYRRLSFAELEAISNRYANGLRTAGIDRGMRTLVMVRPGVDFVGIIFALFKLGAVPVMIDPGMGVLRLLDCVRQVDVEAFIGIPLALAMRVVRPVSFRSVRTVVTVGRRWCWGGPTLDRLGAGASDRFEPTATKPTDPAAILFTSGSTGPAKGVVYEHGMFEAQVRLIRDFYGIEPGEVDLPALPLFVLFSTAMGMTAVIPDMDPSHPARVNPANIVRAIQDHRVTNTFGSPAIWHRVADYCAKHRIKLPSLRRILIAGAPVPRSVISRLHDVLSAGADVHTPYGATESLPVASISGRELLGSNVAAIDRASRVGASIAQPQTDSPLSAAQPKASVPFNVSKASAAVGSFGHTSIDQQSVSLADRTQVGFGTCVGQLFPDIDLRVIRITDDPIERWSDDLLVSDGEVGELVVAGPVVTRAYFGLPQATKRAKIQEGTRIWHRMGDVGYRDEAGRIWFCGRKAHRVQTRNGTLFTECCEPVFNEHPAVFRSALVGTGGPHEQEPVLVVELVGGRVPRGREKVRLREALRMLGQQVETTANIHRFVFRQRLPVDVRHNAKINRERLARSLR